MDYCKYSNVLGEPGKGAHSIRLFNIAVVDVLLTIILAYILSKVFNVSFGLMLVFCFLLGIVLHRIFCVKTTIDKIIYN